MEPEFPLVEWDRLVEKCNITLNLLRSARTNPSLSSYTYIFGEFDFSATSLAPPGTEVVAHIKSNVRRTWELNIEVGWYVGPSMKHYRCVQCYFPRTKTTRDCDTVTFFPKNVLFPEIKLEDFLRQAAEDIVTILTLPPSTTTPSLKAGDPVRNALLTLATQLKRGEKNTYQEKISEPVASPRVQPTVIPAHTPPPTPLPRVEVPSQIPPTYNPVSILQLNSKDPKKYAFKIIDTIYILSDHNPFQNNVSIRHQVTSEQIIVIEPHVNFLPIVCFNVMPPISIKKMVRKKQSTV